VNIENRQKVLFLCTGNSARSQMAEAFLRKYADDHFEVHSAGLKPKGLNPLTVKAMAEIGISMDGHTSTDVKEYLGRSLVHYLITVCAHAEENCPTTWLGNVQPLHWAFDDPAAVEGSEEEKMQVFRRVRDEIDAKIKEWLADEQIAIAE
jgi:arsenate reductase